MAMSQGQNLPKHDEPLRRMKLSQVHNSMSDRNFGKLQFLLGNYTNLDALRADITSRISGATGIFYESELAEGNLRLSFGLRLRYYNHISPALSYDPASDYYVYQGAPRLGTGAFNDSRLTAPKYPIDILASALIDQRAQVNVSFLNLLGQTYYNTAIYPRNGFTFRIDVTWAFLD